MIKNIVNSIYSQKIQKEINFWSRLAMFFISVVTVGAIVIDYGFVLDDYEMAHINNCYTCAWWIYFISFTARLIISGKSLTRKTMFLTVLCGGMLYLSAISRFGLIPNKWQWAAEISAYIESKFYLIALLGLFASLNISRGIVSIINKKTNPAMIMSAGFAVIIIFGTLLLLLPRSTHEEIRLSIADALFVSTSAVCVTGLSPVDIAKTFSPEGQIVITLLIQIGGLGVMTITSFFAMFFMGKTELYSQFALRDMVGSERFNSLISTLLHILGFTFIIEAVGALLIWADIHSTMGISLREELFFSVFHSVSAFCNAGFSTLSGNLGNEAIISGHNGFFIVISLLIILGGIGFPILVNFKRILGYCLRHLSKILGLTKKQIPRYTHLANINTRIVLRYSIILIIAGTLIIALLEWDAAFAQMPVWDKIVHSFFNSVAPRTAGFNSVDLTQFSFLTIILYILLMWIGGASQSTAGGIKVNTLAVVIANFKSIIRGENNVRLFNREISANSVRRASAAIFGSLLIILLFFIALVIMEPGIPAKGLLFETVSAFGTVGSSLNVTPLLGNDSKILVSALMFIGRVGFITVLMSFVSRAETPKFQLPKDNIIIN